MVLHKLYFRNYFLITDFALELYRLLRLSVSLYFFLVYRLLNIAALFHLKVALHSFYKFLKSLA